MIFQFSLAVLVLALGAQIFLRSFGAGLRNTKKYEITKIRIFKYIFIFSVIFVFFWFFHQSWQQYQFWSGDETAEFLLPPHQSINYFLLYAGMRFFVPHAISLIAAAVFFFAASFFNEKYNERFFYKEEYWTGALSIFLVSHPGWLFYGVILAAIYLLIHIFSFLISHFSSCRLSPHYLWIPTAIFVILMQRWLEILPLWNLLKI